MSMVYIIGYNPDLAEPDQWLERNFNSTADIYLHSLISEAIEGRYPELYFYITQERGVEIMRFDELSDVEFNQVITSIRKTILNDKNAEIIMKGENLWREYIEPLIRLDQRYNNV